MSIEEKFEGIVLKTVAYQDFHEIAHLFTPFGLVGVIRKWGRSKKKMPLQALTRIEVVAKQKGGQLKEVLELSELDSYIKLRDSFEVLKTALSCLEAIQKTQVENHSAEPIYLLLKATLEKLKTSASPQNLLASFYLKILLYEGFLPDEKLTLPMTDLILTKTWSGLSALNLSPETHEEVKSLFFNHIP